MISLPLILCFTTTLTASVRGQRRAVSTNFRREDETPDPFSFSYKVKDSDNDYSHGAVSDGRKVTGEYQVLLPDGRMQKVSYTADEAGYNAVIQYIGQAIAYESPSPRPRTNRHSPRQKVEMYTFSETNGRAQKHFEDLNSASQNNYPARPKKTVVYEKDASDSEFKNARGTKNGRRMKKMVVYKVIRTRSTDSQNYTPPAYGNDYNNRRDNTGSSFATFNSGGYQLVNGYQLLAEPNLRQATSTVNSGVKFGVNNVNYVANTSGTQKNNYYSNINTEKDSKQTTIEENTGNEWWKSQNIYNNWEIQNNNNGRIWGAPAIITEKTVRQWGKKSETQAIDPTPRRRPEIGNQQKGRHNGQNDYNGGEINHRLNGRIEEEQAVVSTNNGNLWWKDAKIQNVDPVLGKQQETGRNNEQTIYNDRGSQYNPYGRVQVDHKIIKENDDNPWNNPNVQSPVSNGRQQANGRPFGVLNNTEFDQRLNRNYEVEQGLTTEKTENQLEKNIKIQTADPTVTARSRGASKHFRQTFDRQNGGKDAKNRAITGNNENPEEKNARAQNVELVSGRRRVANRNFRPNIYKTSRKLNRNRTDDLLITLKSENATEKDGNIQENQYVTNTTDKPNGSSGDNTKIKPRNERVTIQIQKFQRERKPGVYNPIRRSKSGISQRQSRSRNATSVPQSNGDTIARKVSAKLLVRGDPGVNQVRIRKNRRQQLLANRKEEIASVTGEVADSTSTTTPNVSVPCHKDANNFKDVVKNIQPPEENCEETSITIEAQTSSSNDRRLQEENNPSNDNSQYNNEYFNSRRQE